MLRDMVAGERATAPNFLRLARLQLRRQDLASAADSVEKGLAKEPANFELLMLQWRLFSETEKWEQAAGLFERGLPVAGKRVGVILSGGNVDLKLVARLI